MWESQGRGQREKEDKHCESIRLESASQMCLLGNKALRLSGTSGRWSFFKWNESSRFPHVSSWNEKEVKVTLVNLGIGTFLSLLPVDEPQICENFGVKPAMCAAPGIPSWLFLCCSVLGSLLGSRLLPSSSVAGSTGKGKGSKADAQHHNPVSALIKCFLLTCTEIRMGGKRETFLGVARWGLKGQ